jgi:hypothetical protein
MPQYMWGYIDFFLVGQLRVGLRGHAPDDRGGFPTREPSASACHKEGSHLCALLAIRRVSCVHPDAAARNPVHLHLDLHPFEDFACVVVAVESQDLRDAQPGAEQHDEQRRGEQHVAPGITPHAASGRG